MNKTRTEAPRAPDLDQVLWEAEKAAATAILDDAKVWWAEVEDDRKRQLIGRDFEASVAAEGGYCSDMLEVVRARWAEEDAAWEATRDDLRRRKGLWCLVVAAAKRRKGAGRPQ